MDHPARPSMVVKKLEFGDLDHGSWTHQRSVGPDVVPAWTTFLGGLSTNPPTVYGPTHGPWLAFVDGTWEILKCAMVPSFGSGNFPPSTLGLTTRGCEAVSHQSCPKVGTSPRATSRSVVKTTTRGKARGHALDLWGPSPCVLATGPWTKSRTMASGLDHGS
uniref:Uncharacterized protein n=1 Tax=Solanum tuberosum TaxID=4113 RepID=M1E0B5_SOLTU